MGTAEGNRLRPEEHTTGAPLVMRAVMHKSFCTLEAGSRRRGWPAWPGASRPARSVQMNSAGHREPRGPL